MGDRRHICFYAEAFTLNGSEAEEAGVAGQTCVIRKIDEQTLDRFGKPATYPIVYVTVCGKAEDIKSPSDLINAGLIRTRDWLFRRTGKYEYRITLRIPSRRKLDAFGFVHLGCFPDMQVPNDEVRIIHWYVPNPSRNGGTTPIPSVELPDLEAQEAREKAKSDYGTPHIV